MEQPIKITKETLIPISLVVTLLTAVWFFAKQDARIEVLERNYTAVAKNISDVPTRGEFDNIQNDIDEIKRDIKTLISGQYENRTNR